MSKTTPGKADSLRSRGNAKSTVALVQAGARKVGIGMATALYEVYDEMTAYPPASAEEANKLCRTQIRRCQANLHNARKRKDHRAVANLQRKLAVYEYLYALTSAETQESIEGVTECPVCRVYSKMENGICRCCGAISASAIRSGTLSSREVSV